MTSALIPNRSSGVRGRSATWLELVFLWVLLAPGCHHFLPDCPTPAAVGCRAGCLQEDLCYCDPTTGVLPPPECFLMMQAGRWHAFERVVPTPPPAPTATGISDEAALAKTNPQPIHLGPPPIDAPQPNTAHQPAPLRVGDKFGPAVADPPPVLASRNAKPRYTAPIEREQRPTRQAAPLESESYTEPHAFAPETGIARVIPQPTARPPIHEREHESTPQATPVTIGDHLRSSTAEAERSVASALPPASRRSAELELAPAPRPAPLPIPQVSPATAGDSPAALETANTPSSDTPSADEPELPRAPRPTPLWISAYFRSDDADADNAPLKEDHHPTANPPADAPMLPRAPRPAPIRVGAAPRPPGAEGSQAELSRSAEVRTSHQRAAADLPQLREASSRNVYASLLEGAL